MLFLRGMLKIPWIAKRSHEEVLKEAEEERRAIIQTRRRQSSFVGSVTRAGGLEYLIATEMIEGKRE